MNKKPKEGKVKAYAIVPRDREGIENEAYFYDSECPAWPGTEAYAIFGKKRQALEIRGEYYKDKYAVVEVLITFKRN